MMQAKDQMEEQALDWLVRTGDPAFEDWEGFQLWLETDPAHAACYHALAADVGAMTDALRTSPAPASRPFPLVTEAAPARRPTRRLFLGGGVAAALAIAVGWNTLQTRPQPYAVETAPGVSRNLTLADGSRIALNGGTRLMLDHGDARVATLERGEALFSVMHDERHPFRVSVGEDRIVDVGTVFAVAREGTATTVSVSEGAVIWNPDAEAVRLDPGKRLRSVDGEGQAVVGTLPLQAVGGFTRGRLVYDGVQLGEVAADLSRALGVRIAVAPALAGRPFRGTVMLDGLRDDPARIGTLLGLAMRKQAEGGWLLTGTS